MSFLHSRLLPFVMLCVITTRMMAQPSGPELVKNIHVSAQQIGLFPQVQAALGDRVLMTGNDEVHGQELWISDGTAAGTSMLVDLFPGPGSSGISGLTTAGNRVFFSGNDEAYGQRLRLTDGTAAGTRLAAEVFASGVTGSSPENITAFDGGVLFTCVFFSDITVWRCDGTPQGTFQIHQQTQDSDFVSGMLTHSRVMQATAAAVYFFLPNESNTCQVLWRTNGTAAGTVKVAELPAGATVVPWMLGHLGETLLFSIRTAGSDYQLWKSEGTSADTVPLKTLTVGNAPAPVQPLVVIGEKGYLVSRKTGAVYNTIWVTDGTAAGTRELAEVAELPAGIGFDNLSPLGGNLIAAAHTSTGATLGGLYKIDLQTGTSSVLKGIGTLGSQRRIFHMAATGDKVFFATGQFGNYAPFEFWVTDGVAHGWHPCGDGAIPRAECKQRRLRPGRLHRAGRLALLHRPGHRGYRALPLLHRRCPRQCHPCEHRPDAGAEPHRAP